MTRLKTFLMTLVVLLLSPSFASAATFEFTYDWSGTGCPTCGVVVATFEGTDAGGVVTVTTVSSVTWNGGEIGTTYEARSWDGATWVGGATVNLTNPESSNFGFFSPAYAGWTTYFYIIPWTNNDGWAVQLLNAPGEYCGGGGTTVTNTDCYYNGYVDTDAITIAKVPEPTTLSLLGLGLVAFGLARRRKGQSATV